MAELTVNNLIKIIIGIFVVIVVVGGLYLIFKNKVIDFFKNMFDIQPEAFLSLLR